MHYVLLFPIAYSFFVPEIRCQSGDEELWIKAVSKFDQLALMSKEQFSREVDIIANDHALLIASECRHGLSNFSQGLKAGQMVETEMFHSFSNITPGVLWSMNYDFGDYQLCLKHGRYVYLGIDFPIPKNITVKQSNSKNNDDWRVKWSESMSVRKLDPFHVGICLPDSCSEADLKSISASPRVTRAVHPLKVKIMTTESKTDVRNITLCQLTAMSILTLILGLGISSAIFNYLDPESSMSRSLKPFDVCTNTRELFSVSHSESMYTNIGAFRFAYIFSSLNTHLLAGVTYSVNVVRLEAAGTFVNPQAPYSSLFTSATAAIPSAITLNFIPAACFAAIKWIPAMSKRDVNIASFLQERVIRTLPVIVTVLLVIQILPVLITGGGPLMKHTLLTMADVCYRNGWREILFVNNLADMRQICMPVAWFISAEFQLYAASFIVFKLIAKFPDHAHKILSLQILIGMIASGYLFRSTGVPPVSSFRTIDIYDTVTSFAIKVYHTINFIAVYPIGIMLGLKLMSLNGKRQPVSYRTLLAINLSYGFMMLLPYLVYGNDYHYDEFLFGKEWELLYASIVRSISGGIIAVAFYALINNQHRYLIAFARSRLVAVCSRLTLCWFLSHAILIILLFASYESSETSFTQTIVEYHIIIITSFVPACLLYVFVEVPFSKLKSSARSVPK